MKNSEFAIIAYAIDTDVDKCPHTTLVYPDIESELEGSSSDVRRDLDGYPTMFTFLYVILSLVDHCPVRRPTRHLLRCAKNAFDIYESTIDVHFFFMLF